MTEQDTTGKVWPIWGRVWTLDELESRDRYVGKVRRDLPRGIVMQTDNLISIDVMAKSIADTLKEVLKDPSKIEHLHNALERAESIRWHCPIHENNDLTDPWHQ